MKAIRPTGVWFSELSPLVFVPIWAAIAFALMYIGYRWIDPLPPRQLSIAASAAGSTYDNYARQYARILARNGVQLSVFNTAGALDDLHLLRDPTSGVQAALTTFGLGRPDDQDALNSLGGVSDGPIFIFYRNAEPITQFAEIAICVCFSSKALAPFCSDRRVGQSIALDPGSRLRRGVYIATF